MTLLALGLLVPASAAADGSAGQLSLPVVLGVGNGFVAGARPEYVIATSMTSSGFELGGYGELAVDDGHLLAAGGLTALHYRANGFAFGPSLGYSNHGFEAGLFVGLRYPSEYHLDIPFGLRADLHVDPDGNKELVVSIQADLIARALLGSMPAVTMARDREPDSCR